MNKLFAKLTVIVAVSGTTAKADPLDDYVACLVGRSAVALNDQLSKQQKVDSDKAQEIAYKRCKAPKAAKEDEGGLEDFINLMVMAMAERLGGN